MFPLLSPSLALLFLLASINAVLFHLLWGRRMRELVLFWVAAVIGFTVGQLVAEALGFSFLTIGPLHLIEGTIGSWMGLFIAKRLKV